MPCPHTFHDQCPDCLKEAAKQALPEVVGMANEEQRKVMDRRPVEGELSPDKKSKVAMLVRDFTRVGSISKSEGMRRITELIEEAEHRGYGRAKEEDAVKMENKLETVSSTWTIRNYTIEECDERIVEAAISFMHLPWWRSKKHWLREINKWVFVREVVQKADK